MKRAITLTITVLATLFLLRSHNATAQSWTTHFLATWDGVDFVNGPGAWVEGGGGALWGSLDDWGAVTGAPASYNGVPGNTYLAELSGDPDLTSDAAMPETTPTGWTLPPGADWQRDADYAVEMAYAVGCGWGPCGGAETLLATDDGRIVLRYDSAAGGHVIALDGGADVLLAGPDLDPFWGFLGNVQPTWHTVRIERVGAEWRVLWDGALVHTQAANDPAPGNRIPAALTIGDTTGFAVNIWLHSVRVDVSLAGATPPGGGVTPTPGATSTPTTTPIPALTGTPTPGATSTPTTTPTPGATSTPTPALTGTPIPGATSTPTPTPGANLSWGVLVQNDGDCAALGCVPGSAAPDPPQVYGQRPGDTSAMVNARALMGNEGLGRVDFLINEAGDGTDSGQWLRFAAPHIVEQVETCDPWGWMCWWENVDHGAVMPPPFGAVDATYVNNTAYSDPTGWNWWDYTVSADGSFVWGSGPAASDQVAIEAKLGDCEAAATTPQFGPGFCQGRHLVRLDFYDLAGNLRQQDFGVHDWTATAPVEYTVEFRVRAADGSVPPEIMCGTWFPVWYGWPEAGNVLYRNYSTDFLPVPAAWQPGNSEDGGHLTPDDYTRELGVGYYAQDFIGFDGVFTRTFTVQPGQRLRFSLYDDGADTYDLPTVTALPGVSIEGWGNVVIDSAVMPPGSVISAEWVFSSWGDVGPNGNTNPAYTNPYCQPAMSHHSRLPSPAITDSRLTFLASFPAGFYDVTAPGNRLELWLNDDIDGTDAGNWLKVAEGMGVDTVDWGLYAAYRWTPLRELDFDCTDFPGAGLCRGQHLVRLDVYAGGSLLWRVYGDRFEPVDAPGSGRRHYPLPDPQPAQCGPWIEWWEQYDLQSIAVCSDGTAAVMPELYTRVFVDGRYYRVDMGQHCSVPGLETHTGRFYPPADEADASSAFAWGGGPDDDWLEEGMMNWWEMSANFSLRDYYYKSWGEPYTDPGVPVAYGNRINVAAYDAATNQWLTPFAYPGDWTPATLAVTAPPSQAGDFPAMRLDTTAVANDNTTVPAYNLYWLAPDAYCAVAPTATVTATPVTTPTATATAAAGGATATPTPIPPTATATPTMTPAPPTATPTNTATPTDTATPTPTFTPSPTFTPTPTPVTGLGEPTPEPQAPPVFIRLNEREGVAQPPFYIPLQTSLKVAPVFAGSPLEMCFDAVCYPADQTIPLEYTYLGMEAQGVGFVAAEKTIEYTPDAPGVFAPSQMLRLHWEMPGVGPQTPVYSIDEQGYHLFTYPGVKPGLVRLHLRVAARFVWDGATTAAWPAAPPDAPAGWLPGDEYTQSRVYDLTPPGRHVYLYLTKPVIESE